MPMLNKPASEIDGGISDGQDAIAMQTDILEILSKLGGHIASCMEIKELEWAGEYRVLQKKIGSTDEVGELMGLIQSYCLEIYQSFEERGMFFDCSGEEENQIFAKVLGFEEQ